MALYGAEYTLGKLHQSAIASAKERNSSAAKSIAVSKKISRLNAHGFRTRELDEKRKDEQRRVLILGDSLTYGPYLPYRVTYPSVLERELNGGRQDGKHRVYALTKTGISIFDLRDYLAKHGKLVSPDLVVYGFCHNDVKQGSMGKGIRRSRVRKSLRLGQGIRYLRAIGLENVARLTDAGSDVILQRLGFYPHWTEEFFETYYTSESARWKKFTETLGEVRSLTEQVTNIPPVFMALNYGIYTDRPSDYSNPDPVLKTFIAMYRRAKEEAKRQGFLVLDFEEEMRTQFADRPTAVMPHDAHPNAELHSVYGRKLARLTSKVLRSLKK